MGPLKWQKPKRNSKEKKRGKRKDGYSKKERMESAPKKWTNKEATTRKNKRTQPKAAFRGNVKEKSLRKEKKRRLRMNVKKKKLRGPKLRQKAGGRRGSELES